MELIISGQCVLIDDEDYDKLSDSNWYVAVHGYARETKRTKEYLHHRIIGKKEGFVVDHINQNKLDNRKENLRHVTRNVNNGNRPKKCVYYDKSPNRVKRWRVVIDNKYIGRYHTEEEAMNVVINRSIT